MKIEKLKKYDHTAEDNNYCVVLSNFEEFKRFSKGETAELVEFVKTHRKELGFLALGKFPRRFHFCEG